MLKKIKDLSHGKAQSNSLAEAQINCMDTVENGKDNCMS